MLCGQTYARLLAFEERESIEASRLPVAWQVGGLLPWALVPVCRPPSSRSNIVCPPAASPLELLDFGLEPRHAALEFGVLLQFNILVHHDLGQFWQESGLRTLYYDTVDFGLDVG